MPVPARPMIAWLHAIAVGANRHFDIALANDTPTSEDGPPTQPDTVGYHNRPGWAPAGPFPQCDDRPYHHPPAAPALPDHCFQAVYDTTVNEWPTRLDAVTPQINCQHIGMVRGLMHAQPYMVCRNCLNNIWRQTWAIAIWNEVTQTPVTNPAPPQPVTITEAGPGGNPYRQFMTLLCRACEVQEIKRLQTNWNTMIAGGGNPPFGIVVVTARGPSLAGLMPFAAGGFVHAAPGGADSWPHVTCKCLEKWHESCGNGSDVCIRHRQREACVKHDELLIVRAQNDKWLRETEAVPHQPGQIRKARPATIRSRARRGIFRACRCGREPTMGGRPVRVYQCLGCEGVIHWSMARPPGIMPMQLPAGLPNADTRSALEHESREYALRRERIEVW